VRILREAIDLSRAINDKQMLGYSLDMYFNATNFVHMPNREEAAREGFAIFSQEVNDTYGLSMAYMNMSIVAAEKGDENEKKMYLEKLKKQIRAAPASFQVGIYYLLLGKDESTHGNFEEAKRIFGEGEKLYQGLGSMNYANAMRSEIGHVERVSGNLEAAGSIYVETIKRWQELGNRSAVAHQLECFGLMAMTEEQPRRAASLFGAAEALREKCQSPMTDEERVDYDRSVARLRGGLAGADFDSVWAEGRGMTMEQAVALAREREKT